MEAENFPSSARDELGAWRMSYSRNGLMTIEFERVRPISPGVIRVMKVLFRGVKIVSVLLFVAAAIHDFDQAIGLALLLSPTFLAVYAVRGSGQRVRQLVMDRSRRIVDVVLVIDGVLVNRSFDFSHVSDVTYSYGSHGKFPTPPSVWIEFHDESEPIFLNKLGIKGGGDIFEWIRQMIFGKG